MPTSGSVVKGSQKVAYMEAQDPMDKIQKVPSASPASSFQRLPSDVFSWVWLSFGSGSEGKASCAEVVDAMVPAFIKLDCSGGIAELDLLKEECCGPCNAEAQLAASNGTNRFFFMVDKV